MKPNPLPTDNNIAGYEAAKKMHLAADPAKPGTERAEFPLPEGIARVEFPAAMSVESYEDMQALLELILRRAKRSVRNDKATN